MNRGRKIGVESPAAIQKREKILAFIAHYIRTNGYSPTYREIGCSMGLSPSMIKYHLGLLRQKNMITFVDERPRTIRLAEAYHEA